MNASLSRWSMAYFVSALVALFVAEMLMASGVGYPNNALGAPATLIVVHLVTIGWLSLLMFGALFQFVPVITSRTFRPTSGSTICAYQRRAGRRRIWRANTESKGSATTTTGSADAACSSAR